MSNEELRKYVYEQHVAGVQDTEIARHLGLTVEELAEKLEGKAKKMSDAKIMQVESKPKQSTEETVVRSYDFFISDDEEKSVKQPKSRKNTTEI